MEMANMYSEKMFDFSLVFSTCVWYDEDTEHMVYFRSRDKQEEDVMLNMLFGIGLLAGAAVLCAALPAAAESAGTDAGAAQTQEETMPDSVLYCGQVQGVDPFHGLDHNLLVPLADERPDGVVRRRNVAVV